jgi:hypothetical protein
MTNLQCATIAQNDFNAVSTFNNFADFTSEKHCDRFISFLLDTHISFDAVEGADDMWRVEWRVK